MLHTWVLQLDPAAVEGGKICTNYRGARCTLEEGRSNRCTHAMRGWVLLGSGIKLLLVISLRAQLCLLPSCK